MKRTLTVMAVVLLSVVCKAQENHTTYLGLGTGFMIAGGIVYSSSLIKGNSSDAQAIRITNRIGTVMGIIGFASFTYGALLTTKKDRQMDVITSVDGLGLRLRF